MDLTKEADFDPEDKFSWYFGPLSRDETNDILMPSQEPGTFLVRESQSIKGDYVLCVKEENKISHYIINRMHVGASTAKFRIGDQEFSDIPALLNFYKTHYLDTTSLIRPAPRVKVIAKFDFLGKDPEDLPFKKGEVLDVISKDEKEWWTCRNIQNKIGQIPVPYVVKYEEGQALLREHMTNDIKYNTPSNNTSQQNSPPQSNPKSIVLPAQAVVVLQRIPNLYDKTQLKLEIGDIVTVTKMNKDGQWEGEINGRRGIFPFTHVRFQDHKEEMGT